jgi:hypothetical protein
VFDLVVLGYELDLLEARLYELDESVDLFVILEVYHSFPTLPSLSQHPRAGLTRSSWLPQTALLPRELGAFRAVSAQDHVSLHFPPFPHPLLTTTRYLVVDDGDIWKHRQDRDKADGQIKGSEVPQVRVFITSTMLFAQLFSTFLIEMGD